MGWTSRKAAGDSRKAPPSLGVRQTSKERKPPSQRRPCKIWVPYMILIYAQPPPRSIFCVLLSANLPDRMHILHTFLCDSFIHSAIYMIRKAKILKITEGKKNKITQKKQNNKKKQKILGKLWLRHVPEGLIFFVFFWDFAFFVIFVFSVFLFFQLLRKNFCSEEKGSL